MKDERLIAERYAQALSAAVPSDDELTRVLSDLRALSALVDQSAELRRALGNPIVAPDIKLNVLRTLATSRGADPTTLRFLGVLAAHERLPLLRVVTAAVGRALDRRQGVVEIEVRSAVPLDDGQRASLQPALEHLAGFRVRLSEVVDETLLGGLVVKIGGTVYDGSVRTQLEGLRRKLTGEMAFV